MQPCSQVALFPLNQYSAFLAIDCLLINLTRYPSLLNWRTQPPASVHTLPVWKARTAKRLVPNITAHKLWPCHQRSRGTYGGCAHYLSFSCYSVSRCQAPSWPYLDLLRWLLFPWDDYFLRRWFLVPGDFHLPAWNCSFVDFPSSIALPRSDLVQITQWYLHAFNLIDFVASRPLSHDSAVAALKDLPWPDQRPTAKLLKPREQCGHTFHDRSTTRRSSL